MPLILAALMLLTTLTTDQKIAYGMARCEATADDYDACAVEINEDGVRMWLHYGCDTYDPVKELWVTDLSTTIVPFLWTDTGLLQLAVVPLIGCPEFI